MLSTPFTDLVGCSIPIQLAPMGAVSGPPLAAAVAEAGGMGMVGTASMPAPAIAAMLDDLAKRTSGPCGVNFLMPFVTDEAVDVAAARVRVVDFYHGDPDASLVRRVHAAGALAGWQVNTPAAARAAVDAGCDLLVVRGIEGGGRMHGSLPLWPALVEILDSVDVPVLAAGGIGTARGIAAALAAGAAGVRLGTRFLATEEADVHPAYRDALIAATAADTVLTDEFSVMWPPGPEPARVLRAALDAARRLPDDIVGEITMGGQTMPVPRLAVPPPVGSATGHVEAMAMYAGQSVGAITKVEPAGQVVRDLARETERLLAAWCS